MKNGSSLKLALGIFMLALVLLPVPFLRAFSKESVDYFDKWDPTMGSCGDHDDNNKVAGTVLINAPALVEPSETFSIALKISGFTEANKRDKENKIILGLDKDDANNGKFTGGKTKAQTKHEVNSNGNSKTPYSLEVTAPGAYGKYTFLAYAVFGTKEDWYYIKGTMTIQVGNTEPVVALTYPKPGTPHEMSVTVNGTAMDDMGIAAVELKVDDTPFTNITSAYNPETGNFTYDLDISELSEGSHQIMVRATDLGGKFSETAVEIIIPAASVTTPETTMITTETSTTTPETTTQSTTVPSTTSMPTTSSTTKQSQTTVTTTEFGSPLFLTVFTAIFVVVMLGVPVLRHKKK